MDIVEALLEYPLMMRLGLPYFKYRIKEKRPLGYDIFEEHYKSYINDKEIEDYIVRAQSDKIWRKMLDIDRKRYEKLAKEYRDKCNFINRKMITPGTSLYDLGKTILCIKDIVIPQNWRYVTVNQYFESSKYEKYRILNMLDWSKSKLRVNVAKSIFNNTIASVITDFSRNNMGDIYKLIKSRDTFEIGAKHIIDSTIQCYENGKFQKNHNIYGEFSSDKT